MTASVVSLAVTAVKGTRLRPVDEIELEPGGVRDNRRFFVIDGRDRMRNGKQLGELTSVVSAYAESDRVLTLTFPDGTAVSGRVEHDGLISTSFFSRQVDAHLIEGPWSSALSDHVGQPLRLVEAAGGVDRGRRGAVSLISRASLARLAEAAGEPEVDARRFRMLVEIDGVRAHQEDEWVGRGLRIGAARVTMRGHVGRCLVTSRDPVTGEIDLPTLDLLREYRGDADTTEPLPFGIYGEVLEPGPVRVGDPVRLLD
ncbi:MAG: MOSC domain-containing protein [Solirubrobacterales bacterium]|nr:MOSC domain-containing protein [Solirubrobacterales bacterium]